MLVTSGSAVITLNFFTVCSVKETDGIDRPPRLPSVKFHEQLVLAKQMMALRGLLLSCGVLHDPWVFDLQIIEDIRKKKWITKILTSPFMHNKSKLIFVFFLLLFYYFFINKQFSLIIMILSALKQKIKNIWGNKF